MARLAPKKGTKRAHDISYKLGCRLRELRTARQLSQADMAHTFGMDRSFISDLERGRKSLRVPMLEVIAEGFGISISELMKDL